MRITSFRVSISGDLVQYLSKKLPSYKVDIHFENNTVNLFSKEVRNTLFLAKVISFVHKDLQKLKVYIITLGHPRRQFCWRRWTLSSRQRFWRSRLSSPGSAESRKVIDIPVCNSARHNFLKKRVSLTHLTWKRRSIGPNPRLLYVRRAEDTSIKVTSLSNRTRQ